MKQEGRTKRERRAKDDGVSEAVSLILILGIVAGVSAAAFAVCLPAYQAQEENEHLLLLEKQFSGLKSGIDLLWLNSTEEASETDVLFSLSKDSVSSGRLDIGAETCVFTAGDETVSVPLLVISYTKDGQVLYAYNGGALLKNDRPLLPASVNTEEAVLICSTASDAVSYYATDPVSLRISADSYQQYRNVLFSESSEYSTASADTVTLVFCTVTEGV